MAGPNGSGKSTLLSAIAGLLQPLAGRLDVPARGEGPQRISYVLQRTKVNSVLPVTVREVVAMGRYAGSGAYRRLTRADKEAVTEAMRRTGVEAIAGNHIQELSGGQQQRVFVAQGLAQDHGILLLDEPLTGIDLPTSQAINDVIYDERTRGCTVILTTHDLTEAQIADHVLLLAGRVVSYGEPREVLTREHLSAAYGPSLLHVVTKKGYGYAPAEASKDKYHGVGKFDVVTGKQKNKNIENPTFTNIFSDSLILEASKDPKICAITAAMPNGTGLDKFEKMFPNRMFDVGIAEQHAVTFAAGLAAEGYKPFVAIYSTFLQRAYDQVVHDVAIQKLPVRFAIDRAGFVGADGPTHAGSFDITYLSSLPNFIVMAPADESELNNMIATCASINNNPSAVRYPRGSGVGNIPTKAGKLIKIGKGRILIEGKKVAILSLGSKLHTCLNAAIELKSMGLSTTVADARFCKPLDEKLIIRLAKNHQVLLTVEEGSIGGFSSHVCKALLENKLLDSGLLFRNIFFPDIFIEQDTPDEMYKTAGLNESNIVHTVINALENTDKKITLKA